MPYVTRDAEGRITAVFRAAEEGTETVAATDPELLDFLASDPLLDESGRAALLRQADLEFIRVLEDLIDVLLKRDVITFTDLPPEAQRKLLSRQAMRSRLHGLSGLIEAEDDVGDGPF